MHYVASCYVGNKLWQCWHYVKCCYVGNRLWQCWHYVKQHKFKRCTSKAELISKRKLYKMGKGKIPLSTTIYFTQIKSCNTSYKWNCTANQETCISTSSRKTEGGYQTLFLCSFLIYCFSSPVFLCIHLAIIYCYIHAL